MIPDGGVPLLPEFPGMGKKRFGSIGDCPCLDGDDDGGRIEEVIGFECLNHLSDRRIHKFDLAQHYGSGGTLGILIAA